MKFKINRDHLYSYRRVIHRFALLPISIDGEIRWLENVYIAQIYSIYLGIWLNDQFANRTQWEEWKQGKARFVKDAETQP
jgi:hypothetical protein